MSCCSDDGRPMDVNDILERLKRLSDAEEFFAVLGVSYDANVLDVSRLHIMKKMGQYLAEDDLSDLPNQAVAARARAMLERAYEDFAMSSPLTHRVFKVLEDNDPDKPAAGGRTFVPLDSVLKSFERE
ncbi:nitrogenase stabilizing/protective protein NifW [Rhizobium sp. 1AS11]|uniref:nitrogenase stabilizing/protective protein NifW n=1 Tax=Rhizobium acaciae TaxID=2989736 RepID=UPI0022236BA9|nr:nitrogenase stabilizing/protective protein NifW [Rhizobium acaciae]MCW1413018.1 nitrogenase stabilizing/protective protein NifW [Rhizobium acaciae]MCW1745170.1 nitrogenase stabilizing/protective protein NifW [Rhizobium acaciae]